MGAGGWVLVVVLMFGCWWYCCWWLGAGALVLVVGCPVLGVLVVVAGADGCVLVIGCWWWCWCLGSCAAVGGAGGSVLW